jgi:hypothetical protein
VVTNPGADLPPERRRWTWEHSHGPRWLLCGDVGFDDSQDDDVPLALCAETDGLFVDLPPRSRKRFTLVGCIPAGVLAELVDRLPAEALGTRRAWLGNISLTAPVPPAGTSPSWWGEELCDVVVLAQRPNPTMPGTVDIDLDGFVRLNDRTDAAVRPRKVDELVLLAGNEVPYGTCVEQVRLLGCRPEPPLLAALDAVGQSTEASLRRRWIRGWVHAVATDGSAVPVTGAVVSGTVNAAEPSRLGAGLVDVTVDVVPGEPSPGGRPGNDDGNQPSQRRHDPHGGLTDQARHGNPGRPRRPTRTRPAHQRGAHRTRRG